jgi:hypothetical protein
MQARTHTNLALKQEWWKFCQCPVARKTANAVIDPFQGSFVMCAQLHLDGTRHQSFLAGCKQASDHRSAGARLTCQTQLLTIFQSMVASLVVQLLPPWQPQEARLHHAAQKTKRP